MLLHSLAALAFASAALAHSFVPLHGHGRFEARAASPKAASWGKSTAHVSETPTLSYDELFTLTNKFFTAFMYPANVAQAKMINSTMLADNIIGRVDVTRDFVGSELNTEYLFGLFTGATLNAGTWALLGVPISYEITHFAATDYVASAAAVVSFNISGQTVPIEIDTWIAFNSASQIHQYDATFRWFDQALDNLIAGIQSAIGATTSDQAVAYITENLIDSICATSTKYCNGTNTQYSSTAACKSYLAANVRFGKSYEMGRNTLLCRMIHQYMIPFRPAVHCPHIGQTGGGMCTDDQTYAQRVIEPLFTNAPFVPGGKQNKAAAAWKV